jgi:hypothetical protein
MRRLLALVAAVGMVAGALYARGRIDDDGGEGGGSGGRVRLVCAPELATACEEADAEVRIEDAAVTADRLVAAETADLDAWVTPGPWPAIVDALRVPAGRAPLFERDTRSLAASRLGVVGPEDLEGTAWEALGRQVGEGDPRLGWRDPASGLGLLHVGAFTAGFFDGFEVATNDLELEPGFDGYLDAVVEAAEVDGDPVARLLQSRAFFDAAATYEAEASAQLDAAAPGRRSGLAPLYPEPVVAVEAVLAGDLDLADNLADALMEEGWVEPGLPTGLSPGVLAALWDGVR